MNYFEANIDVDPEYGEILIAELAEIGFDTFLENESGLQAYVSDENFEDLAFKNLMETYSERTKLFYSLKKLAKQNWNEEWEKNFEPIQIENKINVRALFHEKSSDFEHDIIISPKMSFGTGHHETTSQVMLLQLGINHQGKSVLDVGTGTGILAILAEKLGAIKIRAFDIDDWSVENAHENIRLNACQNISVSKGTIQDQPHALYDILIANINRNILLEEIPSYSLFIKEKGSLILSGFYTQDILDLERVAKKNELKKVHQISKKNWAAIVFNKQNL